jgi:hypothetical protein
MVLTASSLLKRACPRVYPYFKSAKGVWFFGNYFHDAAAIDNPIREWYPFFM